MSDSVIETIKSRIFPDQKFYLQFDTPDQGTHGWKGNFVEVAEAAAPTIILYEQQLTALTIVKRAITGNTHSVLLQERESESGEYVEPFSVAQDYYLDAAQMLYYQRMPATAWLFMTAGLAKPEQMNVSSLPEATKFMRILYAQKMENIIDLGGDEYDGPGSN
jgi:hypothetical protein